MAPLSSKSDGGPLALRQALFLDRDGVINEDVGYAHRPEDIRFIPDIFTLVAAANAARMLVIVVTNQAGIGRGYYTEADFHSLMGWMCEQFLLHGCHLDGVHFCPHHPEHGKGAYKTICCCRKPAPGMLQLAAEEYGLDLATSVLVGDSPHDMEAGRAAGIGTLVHLINPASVAIAVPERTRSADVYQLYRLKDVLPLLSIGTV